VRLIVRAYHPYPRAMAAMPMIRMTILIVTSSYSLVKRNPAFSAVR
jgi:hypothetical protein